MKILDKAQVDYSKFNKSNRIKRFKKQEAIKICKIAHIAMDQVSAELKEIELEIIRGGL